MTSRRHLSALVLLLLTLPACTQTQLPAPAPILLYAGTATSPNDVKAIEAILKERHLDYVTADAAQLNALSEMQFMRYQLLIVPGGHYIHMGEAITPAAAQNVHNAVEHGLNYLGLCAGALLAGDAPTTNFNLTDGVRFDFYAVVNQNIHKAAVPIKTADGTTLDQYWEDGPQLAGWGVCVAKYPDDSPAVAQGEVGEGWVTLCGTHPEAPESWRSGLTFNTPTAKSNAYAAALINSALNRTRLPAF